MIIVIIAIIKMIHFNLTSLNIWSHVMSSTSPVNKYLNMYTFPCYNNNDYKLTAVVGNYRAF